MIPAPSGITAEYKVDGSNRTLSRPVIAFNDYGEPLVVGSQELVTASAYGKYELEDFGVPGYTAMIPGGGWRVRWPDGSTDPVIGWARKSTGLTVALMPDGDGFVNDSGDWPGEFTFYHPDSSEPA